MTGSFRMIEVGDLWSGHAFCFFFLTNNLVVPSAWNWTLERRVPGPGAIYEAMHPQQWHLRFWCALACHIKIALHACSWHIIRYLFPRSIPESYRGMNTVASGCYGQPHLLRLTQQYSRGLRPAFIFAVRVGKYHSSRCCSIGTNIFETFRMLWNSPVAERSCTFVRKCFDLPSLELHWDWLWMPASLKAHPYINSSSFSRIQHQTISLNLSNSYLTLNFLFSTLSSTMQFFKSTLLVAVAFTASLVAASPAPSPESVARSCPWEEYGQVCTYNSDCACLNKCIASVND